MEQTFETSGRTSLYVEIGSGDVNVRADEESHVVVRVEGDGAEDTTVEQRGDRIVVIGPQRTGFFGGARGLDVHVSMPHDSDLATKLGSADLVVTGAIGSASLKSGSGDVQIEAANDEVQVESGSGDITLGVVAGDLRVKSGSGDVTLQELGGAGSISTGSGDVELTHTSGDVQMKTGSGSLRVRQPEGDVALSTASGDLTRRPDERGTARRQERLRRHPRRRTGRRPGVDRHQHPERLRPLQPAGRGPAGRGRAVPRAPRQNCQWRHLS